MTKKLEERFAEADDVAIFHLQTVWEGLSTNTPERGPVETDKYGIRVPVGFDAHIDGFPVSNFMLRYGSGGTPWTTIIDKNGIVRFNAFTPASPEPLATLVGRLRARSSKSDP